MLVFVMLAVAVVLLWDRTGTSSTQTYPDEKTFANSFLNNMSRGDTEATYRHFSKTLQGKISKNSWGQTINPDTHDYTNTCVSIRLIDGLSHSEQARPDEKRIICGFYDGKMLHSLKLSVRIDNGIYTIENITGLPGQ